MKNKKKSAKAGNAERASKKEQVMDRINTFYAEDGVIVTPDRDKNMFHAMFPKHRLIFSYDVGAGMMQVNGTIALPVSIGDSLEDYNLMTMFVLKMHEEFPEELFAYTLIYMRWLYEGMPNVNIIDVGTHKTPVEQTNNKK